jgi:hypothetical protein
MTFQNNCFIATEGIISGFLLSYYSFLGYWLGTPLPKGGGGGAGGEFNLEKFGGGGGGGGMFVV